MAGKHGVYPIRPARSSIQEKEDTEMFEQTFVHGAGEVRKPWPVAASFTGQLILVGIVATVPLMQTARIAFTPPVILYMPPRPAPPPVKVEVRSTAQAAASIVRAVFQPSFVAPRHIPAKIVTIGGEELPVIPSSQFADPVGTLAVGLPVGDLLIPALPKVETAPVKPQPTSVRTSTGVQQALLVYQVKPLYPAPARSARVSGIVRLAAVIARDGTIQHLQLIGGPPLLVKAALDAVQKWRYKPTMLSGEPVEVITEIDVNFTLSN
jgi:protein TonB